MSIDRIGRLRRNYCELINENLPVKMRLDIYGYAFLQSLPAHIGVSDALDSAVETLCAWHRNYILMEKNEVALLRAQARTLSSLRTVLESPQLSRTNETLAAVIILASIQAVSTSHRDGISALLRHRGPPKTNDADAEYYKTLIVAAQGLAWAKSMETRTSCFLDSPEWQATIADALDSSKPLGQKYSIARSASPIIARVPNLLSDTHQLVAHPEPDPAAVAKLARKIHVWRDDALRPDPALRDVQESTLVVLKPYRVNDENEEPRRANTDSGKDSRPDSALDRPPDPANAVAHAAYNELCAYTAGMCSMLATTRRALLVLDRYVRGLPYRLDIDTGDEDHEGRYQYRNTAPGDPRSANDQHSDRSKCSDAICPATRVSAAVEIAVLQARAADAFEPLLEANVRSVPYLNSAFRAIFDAANALDGAETWQDVISARRHRA